MLKGLVPGIGYQISINERVIENVSTITVMRLYDMFKFKDLVMRLGHVMPYFLTNMF